MVKDYRAGRSRAVVRIRAQHPEFDGNDRSLTLREAQQIIAAEYGRESWLALSEAVQEQLQELTSDGYPYPAYRQAIEFYLRDDVADFMCRLSQRRVLRFYYHTDTPFNQPGAQVDFITVHGVKDHRTFAELLQRATAKAGGCASPFFPFFGMRSAVHAPGRPEQKLGRDLRFELDFDLVGSFQALLPIVALLKHYEVPVLVKYSGHRSLHIMIPAEVFPRSMKEPVKEQVWTAAADTLGRLFTRLAPSFFPSMAHWSPVLELTAPYSLHRYHGSISLPLSMEQCWEFDPGSATVEAFPGVTWQPPEPAFDGKGMAELMAFSKQVDERPEMALELARG